ncbi:MAG: hypothetical protein GX962_04815 [Epulopiscium sp.]|nr:hypothetical protein [Candidatus Epulonipiscium sp.]
MKHERKYEIENLDIDSYNLKDEKSLNKINNIINKRLETILHDGRDDLGRKAKVKSITPVYNQDEIDNLLVPFEFDECIGVTFNVDKNEVSFYDKEYINILKAGNEIILNDIHYQI